MLEPQEIESAEMVERERETGHQKGLAQTSQLNCLLHQMVAMENWRAVVVPDACEVSYGGGVEQAVQDSKDKYDQAVDT